MFNYLLHTNYFTLIEIVCVTNLTSLRIFFNISGGSHPSLLLHKRESFMQGYHIGPPLYEKRCNQREILNNFT